MKKLFKNKRFLVIFGYFVILLIIFGPLLIASFAAFAGECLDCHINEGGTDDCVRSGIPFGLILNPMMVVGWLSLISIPFGILCFIGWTIYSVKILRSDKKMLEM
ncbi:MAG: hypothetical protein QM710_01785 [Flavobacterium sp.]